MKAVGIRWEQVKRAASLSEFAGKFRDRRDLINRAIIAGQLHTKTPPFHFLAWAKRTRFPLPADLVEAVESGGEQIRDWKGLYAYQLDQTQKLSVEIERVRSAHADALESHNAYVNTIKDDQKFFIDKTILALAQRDQRIAEMATETAGLRQQIADLESRPPAVKGVSTKERESLLKLVIGMAIAGYSYDPNATKNVATKEIADDLAGQGLQLDEDTVRTYLKQGKELLPGV